MKAKLPQEKALAIFTKQMKSAQLARADSTQSSLKTYRKIAKSDAETARLDYNSAEKTAQVVFNKAVQLARETYSTALNNITKKEKTK